MKRWLAGLAGLGLVLAPVPAHARGAALVLGSASYDAPGSSGWGTAHPKRIFNGGDPSGLVFKISWDHWGTPMPQGHGKTYAFKPGGGYYSKPVDIVIRAQRIGDCADGTHAYTRLFFRAQLKPGGPLQKTWHPWGGAGGNIC